MQTSTATCLALALALLAAAAPAARAQVPFNASAARDVRYCEVVLYYPIPGDTETVKAMAYNTIGVDNCPPEDWQVVVDNLAEYTAANNATAGVLNGPRYFTYDGVATPGGDGNPGLYASFGPIDMEADGVYKEDANSTGEEDLDAYAISQVTRNTTYTFRAGEWVYQLTDADGETYWMQSYSQQLHPFTAELLQDAPATRALLTELPQGWSYDAFVLPETSEQVADGTAYVLSDQYINNYQRTNERMGAWNLPPAMHRLSYLVSAVALLSATSAMYWGPDWPLPVRIALAWTTLVGVVVALAAARRPSARRWRGLFFKDPKTGCIPWYSVLLLWPYHLCVQLVCMGYRSSAHENVFDQLAERLYLGGWPLRKAMLPSPDCAVLDVTNELLRWVRTPAYKAVLVFESWAPEVDDMRAAVDWALAQQAAGRPVFVHCTHGHGRSAVTACAILCAMGQAEGPDEALAKAVQARPGVLPNYRQVAMLREWWAAEAARVHAE